jgi:hypothetical protein
MRLAIRLCSSPVALATVLLATVLLAPLSGCDDTPTTAIVENGYAPAASSGETTTVFQVWWSTTLFPAPVAAGASSESERSVPGSDFAYALLAPGWSPDAGGAPSHLVAVRSADRLSVATHDRLRIVVAPGAFVGDCATGSRLAADDARLITESIFPGPFAGATYDPTTCSTNPGTGDGGAAADAEAGAEGGP